ncbi:MAG: DUF3343 domain-containing protein [Oscillospiraceae bacterium]|nr:DUF3343 domain-containing protein [Oscillospiraceae bacterium]
MAVAFIACRSVTRTHRVAQALKEAGFNAHPKRLPATSPGSGCGHSVQIEQSKLHDAMALLKEAGFDEVTALCRKTDGELEPCP